MIASADLAASAEKTARDMCVALITYQRCPKGGRLRGDLIVSVDQLHERLGHLLACLARKHCEEK